MEQIRRKEAYLRIKEAFPDDQDIQAICDAYLSSIDEKNERNTKMYKTTVWAVSKMGECSADEVAKWLNEMGVSRLDDKGSWTRQSCNKFLDRGVREGMLGKEGNKYRLSK